MYLRGGHSRSESWEIWCGPFHRSLYCDVASFLVLVATLSRPSQNWGALVPSTCSPSSGLNHLVPDFPATREFWLKLTAGFASFVPAAGRQTPVAAHLLSPCQRGRNGSSARDSARGHRKEPDVKTDLDHRVRSRSWNNMDLLDSGKKFGPAQVSPLPEKWSWRHCVQVSFTWYSNRNCKTIGDYNWFTVVSSTGWCVLETVHWFKWSWWFYMNGFLLIPVK